MDPRSFGWADRLLHDVDERRDVVVRHGLALGDAGDEGGVDDRRTGAAGGGVRGWHDAELGPGLHREQLDLEPEAEAGLVGEDRRHLRERVARDHAGRTSTPPPMSLRYCMPSKPISATPW